MTAFRAFAQHSNVEGALSLTAAQQSLQPTSSEMVSKTVLPTLEIEFPQGAAVRFTEDAVPSALRGLRGEILERMMDGTARVRLDGGAIVHSVRDAFLRPDMCQGTKPAPDRQHYVNVMLDDTQLKAQASKVHNALESWSKQSSTVPHWPRLFWEGVVQMQSNEPLHRDLLRVLQAHGYVGDATISAPRTDALLKQLKDLGTPAPAAGSAVEFFTGQKITPSAAGLGDISTWHSKLPSDHQYAGPEIYRSVLASGVRCMRDYVNQFFPIDSRTHSNEYLDLFTQASTIDFALAKAASDDEILATLGTNDQLEIPLRRIAAYVHKKRTGDGDAAMRILAVQPPGSGTDIAPHWLVTEASAYSQAEYKRREMARAQKGPGPKGADKGAGKSKGRGGAKGHPKTKADKAHVPG
ncbi:unnamed protein product [Symbiodinium necroappetens]|uniref:Uncharacterized protein n=1 Tax=Symbiodinium necroappetens TaxID=1628268 RepID=A0A813AAS5_9DINO|nr:unnamed protein product [Symbiodinium sp. CCMP2456]CAE7860469.1 unnamed protein product [Symbiodinium necroappetens]